jgi:TolA-binding protein
VRRSRTRRIARSLIGLGRYDEARGELRGVLQKWPGTTAAAWAEEQTGYSYLDQQKPRQALDYIKRALHNYPPEKHPREMGFPSLKYLGGASAAPECGLAASGIEIALPHLNEGYVQMGDDAAALAEFGKLRAAADVGPTALYYTAVHHQRLGHYDQAIDLFTQYLALPEQFFRLPDAHFDSAMSSFAKGDYDKAIAGWREVATKFPLHYLAEESASWIRIAEGRKAGK